MIEATNNEWDAYEKFVKNVYLDRVHRVLHFSDEF